MVLLGDKLGLDLVAEDDDGNEDEEGVDMATASQEADDVGGGSSPAAGLPAARRSRPVSAEAACSLRSRQSHTCSKRT